jgi:hypothetical protein
MKGRRRSIRRRRGRILLSQRQMKRLRIGMKTPIGMKISISTKIELLWIPNTNY